MSGGPGFGRALLALLLVATVGACATPRSARDEARSPSTTSLGVEAAVAPEVADEQPGSDEGSERSEDPRSPAEPATTASASADGDAPPTTIARNYRELARLNDGIGDHGAGAPGYADATAIVVASADEYLRVTVHFAGQPPSVLSVDEVMGVGVDVFADRLAFESDYQLFADGGTDGWTAYFDTPDGRVRYPGTLTLGASTLVWEIPWAAIGGQRPIYVSAFSDWSNGSGQFGEDFLPDAGKVAVQS